MTDIRGATSCENEGVPDAADLFTSAFLTSDCADISHRSFYSERLSTFKASVFVIRHLCFLAFGYQGFEVDVDSDGLALSAGIVVLFAAGASVPPVVG